MSTVPPPSKVPHLATPEGEAHAFRALVEEMNRADLPRPMSAYPVGALNVMDVCMVDPADLGKWARALHLTIVRHGPVVEAHAIIAGHRYDLWARA